MVNDAQSQRDAGPSWLTWQFAIRLLTGYIAVYILWGFMAPATHGTFENAGQFGDMYGALNAFFAGIAMFGVIAAILLQREQNRMQSQELSLQRQELADTRAELAGQRAAQEGQLTRWDRDYNERNKPLVFCDRVDRVNGSGHDYAIRNVGGGFAVNVYFLEGDAMPDEDWNFPVRALGSIGPNSERRLPEALNKRLRDSTRDSIPHLLIAEGPATRTSQWTPTLNYKPPEHGDPREGHVQHRLAVVRQPLENVTLHTFLKENGYDLLKQLREWRGQDK